SYICCNPDNTEKVLETIDALFQNIKNKGVSQAELDAARNKVLSAITLHSEQPMGRLVNLGFNWVYNNDYYSVVQDVEQVKSVILEDISRLIEQLCPEKFTQFSLGPKELL
ncbi:MAG: insulinase family protein, partial [Phycisphaerae bacterium]|nr:insulinase family protein [Phycisphaerae bacterium]